MNILHKNYALYYFRTNIWEMLMDMNIHDKKILEQCYNFLCSNFVPYKAPFRHAPTLVFEQVIEFYEWEWLTLLNIECF